MAIIDEIPGIEATIQVGGQDLTEYDEPNAEETEQEVKHLATATKNSDSVTLDLKDIPRVRKYIEVTSGMTFRFKFVKHHNFKHQSHHLAVVFKMNGLDTQFLHEPLQDPRKEWIYLLSRIGIGNNIDGYQAQDLMFCEVTTDETAPRNVQELQDEAMKAKKYGVLQILVYQMRLTTKTHRRTDFGGPRASETSTQVPEKALKGRIVTHNVQRGRPRPSLPPKEQPENVFEDPFKRPFAVFEFLYLSKEGLIRESILPGPTPLDNLNYDELMRYARGQYLKEQKRTLEENYSARIKKENDDHPEGNRKRSHGSMEGNIAKRHKESHREDGKVEVDLTD
ncbi:hypothetical protein F4779DRAFT_633916 [Xylariaceae sp. FL0662B]|nr:hypothetical protein F4779DRAFT_633916 [Xylariaceae sp. FL0662B]